MGAALLEVVLPVFAVAGTGFLYARWRGFPVAAVTDLIIHLVGACLVFDAMQAAPRFTWATLRAPASAALIIFGSLAIGAAAWRALPSLRRLSAPAVILPVAFMNAGNLGLPLARLSLGEEGLSMAMIFFVTFAALQYSLGIRIASGPGGAKEALRVPLFHAAILGVVVNQLEVDVPAVVEVPVHMLGQTVIPLMLLSLGASLARLGEQKSDEPLPKLAIVLIPLLRMGGGLLLAFAVNAMLGNEGLTARVTYLFAVMPPAVMNFALVEKYRRDDRETALVSAAIAVGTALALVTSPLVIATLVSP
jgi:predicted permease